MDPVRESLSLGIYNLRSQKWLIGHKNPIPVEVILIWLFIIINNYLVVHFLLLSYTLFINPLGDIANGPSCTTDLGWFMSVPYGAENTSSNKLWFTIPTTEEKGR